MRVKYIREVKGISLVVRRALNNLGIVGCQNFKMSGCES